MLTFDICNEGIAPLHWAVSEMEGLALLNDMPTKVSATPTIDAIVELAALAKPGAEPLAPPMGGDHITGYGPTVQSGYAMAAPTLDSVIDPAEWTDAMG